MQNNKTYEIIENPKMMTKEEMKEKYNGYLLYLVNAEYTKTMSLIRGVPVIKSTKGEYNGVDDGIYEEYKKDKYTIRATADFPPDTGELYCF